MEGHPGVTVLRLGHRPGRDDRMTTHVGLTARAFGADRVIFPAATAGATETVREVTERFGGPFKVDSTEAPAQVLRDWEGRIVHLTMYGERVQAVIGDLRGAHTAPLLVVVGAAKVPFDVYEHADWNIGITNQPHSEVAALAVFLDYFFDGAELNREWTDASQRVVPQPAGKRVEPAE